MARYTVVLEPDSSGRAFTALVPLLPGCVSEGPTIEDALANVREAIEVYLESTAAHGEAIPVEHQPLVVAAVDVDVPEQAVVR